MKKMNKTAALFLAVTVLVSSIPVCEKETDAYTVTEQSGQYLVDELSESAIKALDEVSVTDKEMLEDIIERSYNNDFQVKTYIIRTERENLDTTYWREYIHSKGDFNIALNWSTVRYIAYAGDYTYHTVTVSSGVTFSPFDYTTRTVERWDEYIDTVRDVENRMGILNDSLCDYQKIQLAYIWIKQNVLDENWVENSHSPCISDGQEALEAVLDNHAVCAGYTRIFNRFMHDCGIESYYVSNSSHALNLVKLNGEYYGTDCQVGTLTCDEGYEMYNNNGKLLWDLGGLLTKILSSSFDSINEYNAIIHYDTDFIMSENGKSCRIVPLAEIIEPTCTTDGSFLKEGKVDEHCDYCGEIHSFTLPAAHTYETVDVKQPTCTEEGYIKKVCKECGSETTEILEKAAHDYAVEATESDYDTQGCFTIKCKTCGDIYYQEYKDKLERPTTETTTVSGDSQPVTTSPYSKEDLVRTDRGYGIITWYDAEQQDWYCMQGESEVPMKRELALNGAYTNGLWVMTGTLDKGRLYDTTTEEWIGAGDDVECYFDTETRTWKIYMEWYREDTATTEPEESATTPKETETTLVHELSTTKSGTETTTDSNGQGKKATTAPVQQQTTTTKKVTKPGRMKLKASNKKGRKIKLSWKKVTGATKYQVKYVLGKKTVIKNVKKTKKTYTFSKLKKSKTYKVYIRAYNKAGWGKWSRVKKVKVKK